MDLCFSTKIKFIALMTIASSYDVYNISVG